MLQHIEQPSGRPSNGGRKTMLITFLVFLFIAIFAAIIGFVAFELIEEMRGSHHKLMDRYHE